jgi:hypothetical protein
LFANIEACLTSDEAVPHTITTITITTIHEAKININGNTDHVDSAFHKCNMALVNMTLFRAMIDDLDERILQGCFIDLFPYSLNL